MRIVIHQFEIVKRKVGKLFDIRIEFHLWKWAKIAGKLKPCLIDVIRVQVYITTSPHEFTGLKPAYLSHHQREQRIGRNVEWHAEKRIATALVELTAQRAVGHVKLKQAMAWRQRHLIDE